ncbi:MerR family transcriptional regulator [Clostridium culturomicium]|uniref:hypothetical protein n=1 Tax=Clostridium culturomicium TaxID=1499683 RepID=UPI0005A60A3B|nr:hypothetical protein [Clostridium culturomicium]
MDDTRTLIKRDELAKRWGVNPRTIIVYEEEGILTRNPNFKSPFYYLKEVEEIDKYKPNPLAESERRRLETENKQLKEELNRVKEMLSKVATIGVESMNILTNLNV